MNEVYELYKQEHPEELRNVNRLRKYSQNVESRLQKRRAEKLKRIEKCRRILYGEDRGNL